MANNPTIQSLAGSDNTFKTVLLSGFAAPVHPGYKKGRFYSCVQIPIAAAVGVNTTTLILSLFYVAVSVAPTTIGLTSTIVGAGSSVKCGLWGHSFVSNRASGLMLPGSGSNTAIDTSSGTGLKGNTANITLSPGVPYWFGCAFTGTAPTVLGVGGVNQTFNDFMTGRTAATTSSVTGYTTPFTFANDITKLDLTNATFTDVGAGGVPVGSILV